MSDQQHSGPSGARSGVDTGSGTDAGTGDRIQSGAVTGSGDVQASGTSHDALVGDEGTGAPGAGAEAGHLVERSGQDGELTRTWSNPGLPAHVYRRSDVDPKAAQRREREVATFFGVSTLGTLLFIVAYFAIKPGQRCQRVDAPTWSRAAG